ncbi:hypothetical protein C8J56DRAFT_1053065 [Mycena floridula]|nr:hypothetical protein C8J56DRAFT_1053065 [Mycena floridula]
MDAAAEDGTSAVDLSAHQIVTTFRSHYQRFEQLVQEVMVHPTDSFRIIRIGEDIDEFQSIVREFGHYLDNGEQRTLEINILQMQSDLRLRYNEVLESSHHGTPMLVQQVRSGGRGRPRTMIDPVLLAWAYSQRSTSSIAHFFNVGRTTVRRLLLEYGIVQPGAAPTNLVHADDNFVLDPNAVPASEEQEEEAILDDPPDNSSELPAVPQHLYP